MSAADSAPPERPIGLSENIIVQPSEPPIRTLGQDLADVARYRDLRRALVALEQELRSDQHWTDPAGWYADRVRDLLDRFPEEMP
jgi:hypothetical protein